MSNGTTATTPLAPVLLPDMVALLEAGVHFGHDRSKQNPKMARYVFMQRNRVAILDLEKTLVALERAVAFVQEIAQRPGKEILFVGTKRQAREVIRAAAKQAGMPYVTKRWLGGTLTNFATILKSIEKLDELKSLENTVDVEKLTKKEQAIRRKEIARLEAVLEGMKSMRTLPAAMLVVGAHDEKLAIREANRMGIPVVAIVDTNTNPELIDYPVPANDDAVRSITLIVNTLTEAIVAARGAKQA
jgi:small subunit ribosomal protein S2